MDAHLKFFDATATSRKKSSPELLRHRTDALARAALGVTGSLKDVRLLELGSGLGAELAALRDRGASVVGVERARRLAQRSRHDYGLDIREADARTFRPAPDETFDACLVLPEGILGGGTSDDDLSVLRTAVACVRPGGRIVVVAPHLAVHLRSPGFSPLTCRYRVADTATSELTYAQRAFHRAELASLLRSVGARPLPPERGPFGEPQTQRSHAHVVVIAERSDEAALTSPPPSGAGWATAFFDGMQNEYLGYPFTQGTEYEVDVLIQKLDLRPEEKLLDVGCGVGRHCLALARRGYRPHGIDLSASMIAAAREAAATEGLACSFEAIDGRAIPPGSAYDAAWTVCEGAFGLFRDDEANADVLRAVFAALRPGGRFFLTTLNLLRMIDDPAVDLDLDTALEFWEEAPAHRPQDVIACCNRAYVYPEMVTLLHQVGFEVNAPLSSFCFGQAITRIEDMEIMLVARKPGGP